MAELIKRISPVNIRLRYADRLLIGFLLGVICGTVAANLMYQEVRDQAGYFTELMDRNLNLTGAEHKQLFYWVFRQRATEILFAWLIGLTVFSVPCFYLLATGVGFSMAMMLSIATCQKGLMGLPYYLLSILPHYIIYIPVWFVLAAWAGSRTGKLRIIPLCGLLLIIMVGAVTETFLNPYFLKLLI